MIYRKTIDYQFSTEEDMKGVILRHFANDVYLKLNKKYTLLLTKTENADGSTTLILELSDESETNNST